MEGLIVVRSISEHTMVVMTHYLILYITHEGKQDGTSLCRTVRIQSLDHLQP
jgi:hypothetical protein